MGHDKTGVCGENYERNVIVTFNFLTFLAC